jgi:site-specific DNA recombinase
MREILIYCRVSTPDQKIYGLSPEDQEYRTVSLCNTEEHNIVEILQEVHSAKTFNRPLISKVLKEIRSKNKRFDVILCSSIDRFSRHLASAEDVMNLMIKYKVELWTLDKRYNFHTASGRREFKNDVYRAQDENENRAEKAENSIRNQMRKGVATHRVGIGYKSIPGIKHKDPAKRIPSRVVFDEASYKYFQESGIGIASGIYSGEGARKMLREKYNINIRKQTFYNALKNPFYMGKIQFKDEKGKLTLVNGNHEPIFTEDTWFKIQERLSQRARKVLLYKKKNPLYPLKGYLKCPECGAKLTAGGTTKKKGNVKITYHYYNCQRKKSACTVNLKVNDVHDIFKLRLMSFSFSPEIQSVYNSILSNQFKANDAARDNRIIEIENKLNEITMQKIEALKLLSSKMLIYEDFNLLNETLVNEKSSLGREHADLSAIESSYKVYRRENKTMLQNVNSFFWQVDVETQSEILDTMLDEDVIIDKTHIVKMNLNPIFKLLISKLDTSKNHDEKSSRLQPGFD